jgi:hypothetical protein
MSSSQTGSSIFSISVRDVLASHPLVDKYTGGVQGEGGDGVTVAQSRRR